MQQEDTVVAVLPVYYSDALAPDIHLHQYPLLSRPLEMPPLAAAAGKTIRARHKPISRRMEVHVPLDVRPEVYNPDRGQELGQARAEADHQQASSYRLNDLRLQSDSISKKGAYMLALMRHNTIHLHPFSSSHQFKPNLEYLDVLSRRSARKRAPGDDSDSDENVDDDDGPPPDPDDPTPTTPKPKKVSKKSAGESKEITVTVKKTDEKGAAGFQGGLSTARREILAALRKEEDEPWQDLQFSPSDSIEAHDTLESLFSTSNKDLKCNSSFLDLLSSIGNGHLSLS